MLKIKRCFYGLVCLAVLVFSCVMPVFAESESYEYELDLTCSSTKYFDDEDTTTYFYVETDYEGETVTLVNADDMTEYAMLDDGKFSISGDDLPYDGVYSAKIELDTSGVTYETPKVLSFYAITEDGVISDTITIEIVKRITELQIYEMASVDEKINAFLEKDSYTSASFEEKISMIYELLLDIAENGTDEYPYSLIYSDSISFSGKIYSFKYSCGALGSVAITDIFQTETTTTTEADPPTPGDYEYELDLTCSSKRYYDDEDTLTYFYVETDYEGESVTLVNADDLTEYTMVDDGKFSISGDDLPYDGVYFAKIELDTSGATYENPKVLSFYAITEDGVTSDIITIKIVKRFTELQFKEMNSVDNAIAALYATEDYMSASYDEKSLMLKELLVDISENGTEDYPYSLIKPDSIELLESGKMYAFQYYFGFPFSVYIGELTQPDDPEPETTTTTPPDDDIVYGDANENGTVEIADAVYILQTIAAPSEYKLTEQGKKNADVNKNGNGVDAEDSLTIQRYKAEIIKVLPESYN